MDPNCKVRPTAEKFWFPQFSDQSYAIGFMSFRHHCSKHGPGRTYRHISATPANQSFRHARFSGEIQIGSVSEAAAQEIWSGLQ
jgi:hypothetical protein